MGSDPVGWMRASVVDLAADNGVASGPFGSNLGRKDYQPTGIPVIRGSNLNAGRFVDLADAVFVSEDKADALSSNHAVPGDLVVTQRGTLGQVALVPFADHARYVISQSQMRIRPGPGVDGLFLYYAFSNEEMKDRIRSLAIQTGVPHINLAILRTLDISVPPIGEQRAIAEVLGALDDRIEWCAGAVERLEALLLQLARGDASAVPVVDLATYVNGGAYTKHATGSGRLVIRIAELSSGVGPSSKYAEIDAPPERTAYPGDILFSWSATLDVYRWTADEAVVNQHIFKVLPARPWPAWLVYAKLKEAMPTFQKIAHDRATTMGHIKRGHLGQVSVGLPDVAHLENVRTLGDALWDQHLRVSRERQHLANLRDGLLPRLLSGELRIEDPARVLGALA